MPQRSRAFRVSVVRIECPMPVMSESTPPIPESSPLAPRLAQLLEQLTRSADAVRAKAGAGAESNGRDLLEQLRQLSGEAAQVDERIDRLQRCFDLADVILLVLDATGSIAMINREGCRILGYEDHELLGADWFERCIPESTRPSIKAVFRRIIAGQMEGVDRFENPIVTRAGQSRSIAWHNIPIHDGAGRIVGALCSGRDVSSERSAQSALSETELRFQAIIDTTVDAIITIDERGTVSSFNPAAERMFGYLAVEAIGRNISMLMPAPYREEHDDYLRRYMKTGVRRIIGIGREVVGRRKDGTTFPLDLAVSETKISDRRLFTGIIRDISERKRLEQEVLDVSTQERERIGRDLHDGLGQELTGVAFLAGVLKRELAGKNRPEAESAAEIVDLVNTAISHARALVRGLCPVTLEPDGLMLSLRGLAETVQEVHGLACRFDCPRPVMIDDHHVATHLYYIAQEAVNNAIKHGRPDQIAIGLYAGRTHITLMITDDGIGFTSRRASDSGRGMHIMSYRARMIGGSLEVGPGTTGGTVVTCSFDHHAKLQKD